jgi:beta-galactosidase
MPFSICLFFFFLIIISCETKGITNTNKINFNNDWKFQLGNISKAEQVDFDDSSWRNLDLPHDWSVEGKADSIWASATAYFPTGIGWYRKTFKIEKDANPTNRYIYFDGVMMNSEVWINGKYLGK